MNVRKFLATSLPAALAAILLAGCGSSRTASFMLGDKDAALTLEVEKAYPWSDLGLAIVVRHFPECQRRHEMKPTVEASPKVDVYAPAPQVFILRQNRRWYVTELKDCKFQAFKEAPPEPGIPIGTFQEQDGVYTFVKHP